MELGRNIDTTAAGFLDRTIARRQAAKRAIRREIQQGKIVVRREFSIAERLRHRAQKIAAGPHTVHAQLTEEESLAREDARSVFENIEDD